MESVRITRAASAHPPFRLDRDEGAARVARLAGDGRRVAAIARGTRIASRRLALAPADLLRLDSIGERNAAYRRLAPPLAREAAAPVLPADVSRIGVVASSSCTGYALPGWGASLVGELGLRADTARLPITEAGCAGGAVALARATDFLRARPGAAALAVACELCSLAFHPGGGEGNLTASLLFADGAGAALLENGPGAGLFVVDSASVLIPASEHLLGFDLTDRGFYPVLDRQLARVLAPAAAGAVRCLLRRHELSADSVTAWLLHPGGPRILSGLASALQFDDSRARWSWDSLRDFGNTSSAAIFDVLARYLADEAAPPGPAVLAAFGPGVAVELLLLDRRC
ncbi:MAG: type III polyketide synthase [Dehalococcoidia bacterium]|nr:type III polyketide synthase [Dehalococcoidia bacterium]